MIKVFSTKYRRKESQTMFSTKFVFLFLMSLFVPTFAMEDLYCGDQTCYEVLGVSRDSPRQEISKSYRKLAGKFHPDRFQDKEDKDVAEKQFMKIATAYEVLKDEESREEYNYMLDHPEEMWRNMYRYYRRRMAPKVDVRLVLAITITVISAVQYFSAWSNYDEAIKYLSTVPKYRNQAALIAKEDGLLKRDKKLDKGKSKEQIREEEERVLRGIIENKMDIRGGYAKPKITDVLWIQLILLPVTTCRWIYFYARWFWKFGLMREEYGEEEKLYVIRKNMKLTTGHFDSLTDEEKEDFLAQELWITENFKKWKEEKDTEMRIKMAQSGRYKQYRRYMKNNDSRMTFDDS